MSVVFEWSLGETVVFWDTITRGGQVSYPAELQYTVPVLSDRTLRYRDEVVKLSQNQMFGFINSEPDKSYWIVMRGKIL